MDSRRCSSCGWLLQVDPEETCALFLFKKELPEGKG